MIDEEKRANFLGMSKQRPPENSSSERLALRAVALYQPRTRRELLPEDGREIVANLGGFLSVLAVWKRRERDAAKAGA